MQESYKKMYLSFLSASSQFEALRADKRFLTSSLEVGVGTGGGGTRKINFLHAKQRKMESLCNGSAATTQIGVTGTRHLSS